MPQLGRKYTCYSCHTKFYDLGKPEPLCPKCGADQRDAEETPVVTSGRGRAAARVVEEPPEETEFPDAEASGGSEADEEEETFPDAREEEAEEEEEEEEDY